MKSAVGAKRQGSLGRSRARANPAAVVTRYQCPRCGGDHRADEHGVANLEDFRGLQAPEVRRLRAQVLEEFASSIRGQAEPDHLERVAALLGAIDARLARLDADV